MSDFWEDLRYALGKVRRDDAEAVAHFQSLVRDVTWPEQMPQAFADAVCNVKQYFLQNHRQLDELNGELRNIERLHGMSRYRGIEGQNGVCCDECRILAKEIWKDYQRIVGKKDA